jgi:hypothetical protein
MLVCIEGPVERKRKDREKTEKRQRKDREKTEKRQRKEKDLSVGFLFFLKSGPVHTA